MSDSPLIVALDFPEAAPALALARQLDPARCRVKVGKELFTCAGPGVVEALQRIGFEVFLDLKFHDIPNTVAGAVSAAASLGVWMVNVHASGGRRMLGAAASALERCASRPLLIAVTVLTSLTDDELAETGVRGGCAEQVSRLAGLARECGLDGVVCSAAEAGTLRGRLGDAFYRVTPGIRLPGDSSADQRRVLTPAAALAAGSSHLVIGRSITAAPDPAHALDRVFAELEVSAGN